MPGYPQGAFVKITIRRVRCILDEDVCSTRSMLRHFLLFKIRTRARDGLSSAHGHNPTSHAAGRSATLDSDSSGVRGGPCFYDDAVSS